MLRCLPACFRLMALTLILSFAAPAVAQEQAQPPLADRLPQDVLIYSGWAGGERFEALAEGTHTEALLRQSGVEDLLSRYLPELMQSLARQQPDAQPAMEAAREIGPLLLRRPSAFAFGGMNFDVGAMPRFIWMIDAGEDAQRLERQLRAMFQQAGQQEMGAFLSRRGGIVRFGIGFDLDELDRLADGNAERTLAQAEAFRQMFGRLGEQPVLAAYVDVPGLIRNAEQALERFAEDEEREQARRVIDALGARGLGRIGVTGGFDGELYETRAFVGLTGRDGLLRLVPEGELDQRTLGHVPADSTMVTADQVDLGQVLQVLREVLGQIDPEARQRLDEALRELNEAAGVDAERDVLARFGRTWAGYVSPRVGNGILSGVLVNRPEEAGRLEQAMGEVSQNALEGINRELRRESEGMASLAGRTVETDGQRLWVLNLPLVAPSWGVDEEAGAVRFAFYPHSILSARMVEGESFVESEAWQRMRERLAPEGEVIGLRYADLPALAPHSYPLILTFSQVGFGLGDLFGEHLQTRPPVVVLPPLAVLMEHVEPSGAVFWRGEEGVHYRSLEPFPLSAVLTTDAQSLAMNYASTSISVMLPALARAREAANRVRSGQNLRQIAAHSIGYAVEETDDQRLPASLRELQESEFRLPMETFISPRTGTRLPEMMAQAVEVQAQWVEDNSDYVWAGGGRRMVELMPNTPIAWEKPELVTEGINIAFADGSVRWVPFPQAYEIIRQAPRRGGREER